MTRPKQELSELSIKMMVTFFTYKFSLFFSFVFLVLQVLKVKEILDKFVLNKQVVINLF